MLLAILTASALVVCGASVSHQDGGHQLSFRDLPEEIMDLIDPSKVGIAGTSREYYISSRQRLWKPRHLIKPDTPFGTFKEYQGLMTSYVLQESLDMYVKVRDVEEWRSSFYDKFENDRRSLSHEYLKEIISPQIRSIEDYLKLKISQSRTIRSNMIRLLLTYIIYSPKKSVDLKVVKEGLAQIWSKDLEKLIEKVPVMLLGKLLNAWANGPDASPTPTELDIYLKNIRSIVQERGIGYAQWKKIISGRPAAGSSSSSSSLLLQNARGRNMKPVLKYSRLD